MSDFMESAKNFVNAAVSRTGWEAQKQMRIHSKQSEVEKLLEQRQQLLNDLGLAAITMYQQGTLTDAQLSRICASIIELDHDMRKREAQLQDIKNEVYVAEQFSPSPTMNYTPPPVNTPPPPSPGPGAAAGASSMQRCPHCGDSVRSNSLYCRSCGTKLR
jgi:hypothetical protein